MTSPSRTKPKRVSVSDKTFNNNPGLPQGFLRFGTAFHKVLLCVHGAGRDGITINGLRVELPEVEARHHLSTTISRLVKYGYIFQRDKVSATREKAQWVYTTHKPRNEIAYQRMTNAEKMKACRARKKMRVPSVFDFRGQIGL
jgi:hypothetical protein